MSALEIFKLNANHIAVAISDTMHDYYTDDQASMFNEDSTYKEAIDVLNLPFQLSQLIKHGPFTPSKGEFLTYSVNWANYVAECVRDYKQDYADQNNLEDQLDGMSKDKLIGLIVEMVGVLQNINSICS